MVILWTRKWKFFSVTRESQFKCTVGDQDEFTESETEPTFEDSAIDEVCIRSTAVQASSYHEQAGEFLKDHRDKKFTTRVGPNTQLLQCAKEDLNLKKN